MKYFLIISFFLTFANLTNAQKNVSITIDDVTKSIRWTKDSYDSRLLDKLDSLDIPIAIFINEGLLYKEEKLRKNSSLINNWVKKDYITLGNHTFSHSRYSTAGFKSFTDDILKGESISRKLADKYNKPLRYFRFPYNDLGKDSLQHVKIKQFLSDNNYVNIPFTIESSDWVYNKVYEYYLNRGEKQKAREIGIQYVDKTLEYFDFFNDFSVENYGRSVNQIYLCHDSKLNADFLDLIVQRLKDKDYSFISLKDALSDKVYAQKDSYFRKWGVSWFYRWIKTQKERVKYMKQEPSMSEIASLFNSIK